MQVASASMLKRQGLTPVDVFFGEARPNTRSIIELGDSVQDRRGDIYFFAGVDGNGKAILAETMKEAERLHQKVIEDRKHWSSNQNRLAVRKALNNRIAVQNVMAGTSWGPFAEDIEDEDEDGKCSEHEEVG